MPAFFFLSFFVKKLHQYTLQIDLYSYLGRSTCLARERQTPLSLLVKGTRPFQIYTYIYILLLLLYIYIYYIYVHIVRTGRPTHGHTKRSAFRCCVCVCVCVYTSFKQMTQPQLWQHSNSDQAHTLRRCICMFCMCAFCK